VVAFFDVLPFDLTVDLASDNVDGESFMACLLGPKKPLGEGRLN